MRAYSFSSSLPRSLTKSIATGPRAAWNFDQKLDINMQ